VGPYDFVMLSFHGVLVLCEQDENTAHEMHCQKEFIIRVYGVTPCMSNEKKTQNCFWKLVKIGVY